MLGSLPSFCEQELLYSALARLGRYLQVGDAASLARGVMGRRFAVAAVDLPGGLGALARDVDEAERDAAIDGVIDRATLFPIHTAFVPGEVRDAVRSAMRGDVAGVHTRLGLATFKVRRPERLRFCPACLDAMEAERGEPWWRRDHQLPGVEVCPVHGVSLHLSEVVVGDLDRHAFIPASRSVCRVDAAPCVQAEGEDLVRLADLSRTAAALLVDPGPARSYREIEDGHRARLAEVGLMRSPRKVDHAALHAAFHDRWGGVDALVPGLELDADPERSWLSALVRNARRAAHPLQQLLLSGVFDALAPVQVERPFGVGPWPCRNPVAEHHGRDVIERVEVRRDRGVLYGDFACSCGYLYTRARLTDGTVGEPRYRRFGALLVPTLEAALKQGEGLRATARLLSLDPKTLMREAAMAGVAVPWSTAASGKPPRVAESAPVTPTPVRARRRCRPSRRNWFAIDARLERSARAASAAILHEKPPVRVTFTELERRIARRDWVQKRRAKLPRTLAAARALEEDVDGFRRRRLAWCAARAMVGGETRPCQVLRAAGLRKEWLPAVREALAAAMVERRRAA